MLSKYLKYALLLNAEIVSQIAGKVKENTEKFVNENADQEYKISLDKTWDDLRQRINDISPKIDLVNGYIEKIKENIPQFDKKHLFSKKEK